MRVGYCFTEFLVDDFFTGSRETCEGRIGKNVKVEEKEGNEAENLEEDIS